MNDETPQTPQLVVDQDWKEQAQREKGEAEQKAADDRAAQQAAIERANALVPQEVKDAVEVIRQHTMGFAVAFAFRLPDEDQNEGEEGVRFAANAAMDGPPEVIHQLMENLNPSAARYIQMELHHRQRMAQHMEAQNADTPASKLADAAGTDVAGKIGGENS